MTRPSFRASLAAPAILIAVAVFATPASAASTRAEYVAQVDPICRTALKPEGKAGLALLKGLTKLGNQSENGKPSKKALNRFLRQTAKFFGVLARLENSVNNQIATVPAAPGDESTIATWLQQRGQYADLLRQSVVAVKHHRLRRFVTLADQSDVARDVADATVAGFGFRYCVSAV
jgi:hypothetical protein